MSDTKKPVARVSIYPISAAVWRNENEGKAYYAVTFERSYKDETGEWKTSSSFSTGELLLLAKVANLAHTEVCKLRAKDRKSQQSDE